MRDLSSVHDPLTYKHAIIDVNTCHRMCQLVHTRAVAFVHFLAQARYTHSGSSQPTGQVMSDGGTLQVHALLPTWTPNRLASCDETRSDVFATCIHSHV